MHIDPEFIINSIEASAHKHYREGSAPEDRLAWQVGALSAKVRELCALLQYNIDQLAQLKKEMK